MEIKIDQSWKKHLEGEFEKTYFKNISDAAKDVKVSHPALRRRILTDVHVNNHHWIFNKDACHYK